MYGVGWTPSNTHQGHSRNIPGWVVDYWAYIHEVMPWFLILAEAGGYNYMSAIWHNIMS